MRRDIVYADRAAAAGTRPDEIPLRRLLATARRNDEPSVAQSSARRARRRLTQRGADARNIRAVAEERHPDAIDKDSTGRAKRLRKIESSTGAGCGERRRVFREVRRHTGNAHAADDLAAAIDRHASRVDRHREEIGCARVEHIDLTRRDADRGQARSHRGRAWARRVRIRACRKACRAAPGRLPDRRCRQSIAFAREGR